MHMSAFGGKADMTFSCTCLLLTQSGHGVIIGTYVKLSIVVTTRGRHETAP